MSNPDLASTPEKSDIQWFDLKPGAFPLEKPSQVVYFYDSPLFGNEKNFCPLALMSWLTSDIPVYC